MYSNKSLFISLAVALLILGSSAQGFCQIDSLEVRNERSERFRWLTYPLRIFKNPETHSVQRAVIYSAVFPGLGQVYNRKYWKVPLVYAALGGTGYFIYDNNRQYRYYLDGFERLVVDGEDIFGGRFTPENLIFISTTYRRWRDLSIILFVAAYGLNILDAYVDAHFFYYDINDNLSINISPSLQQINTALIPGVQFTFIFDSGFTQKSIKKRPF